MRSVVSLTTFAVVGLSNGVFGNCRLVGHVRIGLTEASFFIYSNKQPLFLRKNTALESFFAEKRIDRYNISASLCIV